MLVTEKSVYFWLCLYCKKNRAGPILRSFKCTTLFGSDCLYHLDSLLFWLSRFKQARHS